MTEDATPVMHKLMRHLTAGRYESPGVEDRAGEENGGPAATPPARARAPVAGDGGGGAHPRGRPAQPSRMQPGTSSTACVL